jgi:hypothetical protein
VVVGVVAVVVGMAGVVMFVVTVGGHCDGVWGERGMVGEGGRCGAVSK